MTHLKCTFVLILVFVIITFGAKQIHAACDPPECGTADTGTCQEQGWSSRYICRAYCCVIPATPTPAPATPTPAPTRGGGGGGGGNLPIGFHDISNCSVSTGWTCDADNYSQPLAVHFYKEGDVFIGATTANRTREPAVAANCGGYANHGFVFQTPWSVIDGQTHNIYAYAINIGSGTTNPLLRDTPKTINCTPTCSISLVPTATTITQGQNQVFSVSVNSQAGNIDRVNFASSNSSVAPISPASDSTAVYETTAQGAGTGTTSITANVVMSGAVRCSASANLTITPPNAPAWWQVKDGDVTAKGNISSRVPAGNFFEVAGGGGYPGIPVSNGQANFESGSVSSKGWLVANTTTLGKNFDSQWFKGRVPEDVVFNQIPTNLVEGNFFTSGGQESYGYYWYRFDGSASNLDLTINNPINLGSRKVILFVDSANLYLNGNINLTDGQGFFLAVVGKNAAGNKGNLFIGSGVGEIEGLFVADSTVRTGAGSSQLRVRGAITAYLGIFFERDLGGLANNTTPAEIFEYAPDLVILYPPKLSYYHIRWKEVAP